VNDLAVSGARPLFLSCGMVLEEGLPVDTLRRIALSMRRMAERAGVAIVTGDTKVVERGAADKLFINTSGIGVIETPLVIAPRSVQPGDAVKGYLGSAEDKDWFVFTPATSGYLVGRVTAPEGVEISVTVGDPSPTSGSGRAAKADRSGQLKIPAKAGTRTWIGLMRKLPPGTDAKLEALEGLDAPYELKFELRTAP
jgi:hypothetical protein